MNEKIDMLLLAKKSFRYSSMTIIDITDYKKLLKYSLNNKKLRIG